jgi:hypothetical protein
MIMIVQVGELAGIAVGATVMLNILIAGYDAEMILTLVPHASREFMLHFIHYLIELNGVTMFINLCLFMCFIVPKDNILFLCFLYSC